MGRCSAVREGGWGGELGGSATVNELLMGINPKQRDEAETNVHWHEFHRDGQRLKDSRAAWQLHTAVS